SDSPDAIQRENRVKMYSRKSVSQKKHVFCPFPARICSAGMWA
ncbi:hypothetical protein A2U01_0023564, partial [Trifolium medium]|nr:hypothetical protein [Trifolium medium]